MPIRVAVGTRIASILFLDADFTSWTCLDPPYCGIMAFWNFSIERSNFWTNTTIASLFWAAPSNRFIASRMSLLARGRIMGVTALQDPSCAVGYD